jgi:hypothetical protein
VLLLLLLQGGFQQEMSRREAALILGLRESAAEERIKEAHRRIMIANHPDSGEPHFQSETSITMVICRAQGCQLQLFNEVSIAAGPCSVHPNMTANSKMINYMFVP